jgi:protein-tyrosine phosphatase/Fe-S-cluster containining protein
MIFSLFKKTRDPVYPLTWVTPRLAVGHAPMSHAELDSIKNQGIRAIMNLCMEIEELARFEQEKGFEVYYLPIMDAGLPELEELEKALDWLDECIYLGKKVLIHCRHGIGRTGTVVYSYLLRKGLDSKSAGRKMRGFRARPTEQPQKRFLHLYGKKEAPLRIAEPSLIPQFKVELKPYFDELARLLERVEMDIPDGAPRCGRDHSQCCHQPVRMSLAEAVYLQFAVNTELSREERQTCIHRALEVEANASSGEDLLPSPSASAACPLLQNGECRLYHFRPLMCRIFDLGGSGAAGVPVEACQVISGEILAAFLGKNSAGEAPAFELADVVSGKFVQRFFHLLASPESAEGAEYD